MLDTIKILIPYMKGLLWTSRSASSIVRTECRRMYSTENETEMFEEQKVKVKNIEINYVKVGSGVHTVLLLPGAVGSIWTDFKHQIEHLNKEKFTIVAWDPPGYGKSRPPDRTFPLDFFERDASFAHNLMGILGYKKFSLVGWSDGGITALFMASCYPDSINKLVILGGNAYILPEELNKYESIRNIDNWSKKMRAPLISVYGEDYFRKVWSKWVDAMHQLYERRKGDLCRDALPSIKCPTLVVHGAKDVMVDGSHCIYLRDHISGAKLRIFEQGSHNLHIRYYEEFNSLLTDFLLNATDL